MPGYRVNPQQSILKILSLRIFKLDGHGCKRYNNKLRSKQSEFRGCNYSNTAFVVLGANSRMRLLHKLAEFGVPEQDLLKHIHPVD